MVPRSTDTSENKIENLTSGIIIFNVYLGSEMREQEGMETTIIVSDFQRSFYDDSYVFYQFEIEKVTVLLQKTTMKLKFRARVQKKP